MPYIDGVFYTNKEVQEKTSTVGNAVKTAQQIVKNKNPNACLCTNAVRGRSYDEQITLHQHGVLVDEIVSDTAFYSSPCNP